MTAINESSNQVNAPSRVHDRWDVVALCALVALATVSRLVCRGTLYFVDGPRIVDSILKHTYVIQSPGYWTLAHLGGLFRNPETGLAFWNITFSALGVGVFYLLCRLQQGSRSVCCWAALAYGSVYFIWFAGEIHSSYASQILFAPLALYCFFRYRAHGHGWWACGWAIAAAIGMALRPSDGVFLLPLNAFLLWRHARQMRTWVIYLLVNAVVFLCWYLPTRSGLHTGGQLTTGATILISMQTVSPLLTGVHARSMANTARVVLPMLAALWPLFPSLLARRRSEDTAIGLLWIVPGICFFLLCYMADPTYLVFLSGGCFWLAATSFNIRRALICLVMCATVNTALFLYAKPLGESGVMPRLIDFYVVKYCRYGIRHQWSSTVGEGARVP